MVAEIRQLDRRSRGELIRLDRQIERRENREAWGQVIRLADHVHLAVVADRPDLASHSLGQISRIATRRLRQMGDNDAA